MVFSTMAGLSLGIDCWVSNKIVMENHKFHPLNLCSLKIVRNPFMVYPQTMCFTYLVGRHQWIVESV